MTRLTRPVKRQVMNATRLGPRLFRRGCILVEGGFISNGHFAIHRDRVETPTRSLIATPLDASCAAATSGRSPRHPPAAALPDPTVDRGRTRGRSCR